jgi:hypothetical protein
MYFNNVYFGGIALHPKAHYINQTHHAKTRHKLQLFTHAPRVFGGGGTPEGGEGEALTELHSETVARQQTNKREGTFIKTKTRQSSGKINTRRELKAKPRPLINWQQLGVVVILSLFCALHNYAMRCIFIQRKPRDNKRAQIKTKPANLRKL